MFSRSSQLVFIALIILKEAMLAATLSSKSSFPLICVFGRPGAGKSIVANSAIEKFRMLNHEQNSCVLGLDLDVCVPQWMRDNFAKGQYPTLLERQQFATEACDYVEQQVQAKSKEVDGPLTVVVSFSFVNTDLRTIFRERFPQTQWILIDTSETEANVRINQREGHFYKGSGGAGGGDDTKGDKELSTSSSSSSTDDQNNSEWKFAPVDFEHTSLDGKRSIEENAEKVLEIILYTSAE